MIEWNSFATAHNKNAHDGTGCITKRELRKKELVNDDQQLNTEWTDEILNFCLENLHEIKFFSIESERYKT